jgi:hypothetical protein
MTEAPSEQQFRIPKVRVPVVCFTIHNETIDGDIFLDDISFHQVSDFLNDEAHFFPILTPAFHKPILLHKDAVIRIDIPEMLEAFEQETSVELSVKRTATLHLPILGELRALIILELPQEYSRILDLLKSRRTFLPAIIDQTFSFLNSQHIYKILEE